MRPILPALLFAASAFAQDAATPVFDVASVKVNAQYRQEDRSTWQPALNVSEGGVTFRNADLIRIVSLAYDVQVPRIVGPDWADSMRYDIIAKTGAPAATAEVRAMLRALLAERFKLTTHRETRQMEAMVLLLPKGGSKLKPSKVEGPTRTRQDPELGTVVEGAGLGELMDDMAREVSLPIVDMTGLTGRFDFAFNPQKYIASLRARLMAEGKQPPESEIKVTLMQELIAGDLGLKLENRRAQVEVLVIDKVEKAPTEN
jgi:uncharacterized protein (TIGR03435 family)